MVSRSVLDAAGPRDEMMMMISRYGEAIFF